METIGSRIKSLRKQRKFTQQGLAEMIGLSKTSVIYWEKDENIPKHESLVALADKLDTTIDYILYGVTERKGDKLDQLIQKLQLLSKQGELTDERIGLLNGIADSWKPLSQSEITAQKTG